MSYLYANHAKSNATPVEAAQPESVRRPAKRVDRRLPLLILLLSAIGSVMIFSASYANAAARYGDSLYYIKRQILWLVLGLGVMLLFSRISPAVYEKYTPHLFIPTLLLLLAVLIVGDSGGGAKRWIAIGSLTFQPSELAKTTLVLMLARHFHLHSDKVLDLSDRKSNFLVGTLAPLGYIGLVCGLVALEKHLSCIIILGLLGVCMMFAGGSRSRYLALFGAAGGAAITALALFTDYTKRRILIWSGRTGFQNAGIIRH